VNLTHLKEYQKSELIAARVASAKMGFFTRPKGENELGDEADSIDPNALIQEAEPGMFDILPDGYQLQTFDPDNPNGNFPNFVKAILRGVAASVGIGYFTIANDLESTSYSSLRQGAIDERETYKDIQQWLIERFLTPVFEEWLKMLLAFRLDGMRLPLEMYDKFNAPQWRPRTWQWIDPAKETAAIKMQLAENIRSRTDVARQMGYDYVDVLEEIANEQKLAKEMGVVIEPTAEVSKTEVLQGSPDAEDDAKKEEEDEE
jgi:lambda family phage portal protein